MEGYIFYLRLNFSESDQVFVGEAMIFTYLVEIFFCRSSIFLFSARYFEVWLDFSRVVKYFQTREIFRSLFQGRRKLVRYS